MHFWHKRCGHEQMITVVCDSGGRILVSIIILSTVKSSRNGRKSDSKDFGRGRKRSFYWLYKILSLSALRAAAADAPRSLTTCQYHIIQNEFSMRYY